MTDSEVTDQASDEESAPLAAGGGDQSPGTARAAAVVGYVVRGIVDQPDAVSVSIDLEQTKPRVNVEVGPGDMGRVIGKRGRVANAIRAVGRAAAARDGDEIDVEFVD